jgi:hypothetical protein
LAGLGFGADPEEWARPGRLRKGGPRSAGIFLKIGVRVVHLQQLVNKSFVENGGLHLYS